MLTMVINTIFFIYALGFVSYIGYNMTYEAQFSSDQLKTCFIISTGMYMIWVNLEKYMIFDIFVLVVLLVNIGFLVKRVLEFRKFNQPIQ